MVDVTHHVTNAAEPGGVRARLAALPADAASRIEELQRGPRDDVFFDRAAHQGRAVLFLAGLGIAAVCFIPVWIVLNKPGRAEALALLAVPALLGALALFYAVISLADGVRSISARFKPFVLITP